MPEGGELITFLGTVNTWSVVSDMHSEINDLTVNTQPPRSVSLYKKTIK